MNQSASRIYVDDIDDRYLLEVIPSRHPDVVAWISALVPAYEDDEESRDANPVALTAAQALDLAQYLISEVLRRRELLP